jgi:hypothetical protein
MRKGLLTVLLCAGVASASAQVKVTADESARKVDVTIDGKPFTSYVWPTSLKKPVLYPLITDEGVTVTRGYPLSPRPDERVDHPHHAGLWFNYGNANGFDFWNNSDAIKPEEQRAKYGTIRQEKIVSTKSGADHGELVVDSIWQTGAGNDILKQRTRYVFSKRKGARVIDETTTLTALDQVVFNDDKEGLLGMRVASWLESPDEKGGIFMDASGKPTKVDAVPNSTATGVYETSEGVKGGKVWSTRGRWCTLTGNTGGKTVTIAMIDEPKNPGYPTYWHARGYGLFAANPLGKSIFDPKAAPLKYSIEKGKSATFHYRVILFSNAVSADAMNHEADSFAAQTK